MDIQTQEKILEQIKALPPDIQKAILSADVGENLAEISKKHGLRVDHMASLENETMFVLLGLEHPSDYIANLKKEAGLDDTTARAIAEEVNMQIFRPIRESLKQIHQIGDEVEKKSSGIGHRMGQVSDVMGGTKGVPAGQMEYPKEGVPMIEHEDYHDEKASVISHRASGNESPGIGHQSSGKSVVSSDTESGTLKAAAEGVERLKSQMAEPSKKPVPPVPPVQRAQSEVPDNLPIVESETTDIQFEKQPGVPDTVPDEELNHDEVLKELEGHVNQASGISHRSSENESSVIGHRSPVDDEKPKNLVEEKLKGAFTIPKEESEHTEETPEPEEDKKRPYGGTDPYREPVE